MTTHLTWLALADGNWFAKLIRSLSASNSPTLQFTVFFGVFFLVVIGIFIWAAFYRKPTRSHHHKHHHRRHNEPPAPLLAMPEQNAASRPAHHHRRRRRRSRHKESPRNPTLAETGGLPPVRSDESAENSSAPPG